jgi:tetratricopeptide (TPR) repeat protein
MLSFNPNQPLYLDNMGSYYLVFQKDSKKALKYYNKVLKKHPDDITAIRNCVVLARKDKNVKLEKKYLEMMVRYARAESDRLSAEGRLTVLNSQKK